MRNTKVSLMVVGLLTGGLMTSTLAAQAQKTPVAQTGKGAADRKEDRKERKKLDLGLTKDQKVKMKAIRGNYKPKIQALRSDKTLAPKQKREQLKSLMLSERNETNAILTPEQRTKLAAFRRDEKQEKHGMSRIKPGK